MLERGFTLKLPRKIIYNPQNPKEFYLPGCEYYSRKAAVFRYILFSMLLFLHAVSELFCECEVDYEQNRLMGFACPFR